MPRLDVRPHPFSDRRLAALYDCFPFDADVPFYLDLADRAGKRLLEVACGSGRLLVPLARAGCDVVGVDSSPAMLARAREKLSQEPADVAGRARLVEADMRSFDLGCEVDLAVLATKSFAYLQTRAEQLSALERVADHLAPGGLFALDLLNPTPAWLSEPPGSVRQDVAERLPSGEVVLRTETTVDVDLSAQVKVTRSVYERIDPDGQVTKTVVEWPFRYTFRQEAEHLLERAGFDVESVHGWYDGRPFDSDSQVLLLVGRRR